MAMKKLRAKLYSMYLEEETRKRYSARKIQVKLDLEDALKDKNIFR